MNNKIVALKLTKKTELDRLVAGLEELVVDLTKVKEKFKLSYEYNIELSKSVRSSNIAFLSSNISLLRRNLVSINNGDANILDVFQDLHLNYYKVIDRVETYFGMHEHLMRMANEVTPDLLAK